MGRGAEMMGRLLLSVAMASTMVIGVLAPASAGHESPDGAKYTAERELRFPEGYREWIFLTSGVDMTYDAKAEAGMSMFGNVFVNPSSYREFQKTGTWPEGTALVLEDRGAVHGGEKQASINKHGFSQTEETMGMEVHVKDATVPGGWGFYAFDREKTAKMIPRAASCYRCHEAHAAVDTTFVQFYPTLLGTARAKGVLSKGYLAEVAAPTQSK